MVLLDQKNYDLSKKDVDLIEILTIGQGSCKTEMLVPTKKKDPMNLTESREYQKETVIKQHLSPAPAGQRT